MGFTLIETTLSITMLALFIAMLLVMNSNILGLLRNSKDNVSASQALQERIEQMRIANWAQITDADYLVDALQTNANSSAMTLPGVIEKISISAYPPVAGSPAMQLTRSKGVARLVTPNTNLKEERMVRVDLELSWEGFPQKRRRLRMATATIAKGGITK